MASEVFSAREGSVNPINAMNRKRMKTPQQVLNQLEKMYNHPRATGNRRNYFDAIAGEIEERLGGS